ncbi:quinone oxidoreductase PIG3-like [Asterias amurensis]|uniref:quinone oxidoreductase PIG3-like n=1 Tax=Asterias amurensis TaxID=7602 RepID=UPI003AB6E105
MATMRAVQFDKCGGPEELFIGEVPRPELGAGEILVKVFACSVNRYDTQQVDGFRKTPGCKPIIGLDAAGEVVKVGKECSKWKPGDRVAVLLKAGGYAEYVTVIEDHVIPIPSHMTMEEAASIPESWIAAYQLLHFVGHVKEGDKVLVHAAGSGLGTAAVQLVRLAGAEAIITAGTEAKVAVALNLGAVAGFNYKEVDFAEKVLEYTENVGVDVILDFVGGSFWDQNVRVIKVDGTWVVGGVLGDEKVEGTVVSNILWKRIHVVGSTLLSRSIDYKSKLIGAFNENVMPHFGVELKPVIFKVFPWENVGDAHRIIRANQSIGKIVLRL